MFAPAAYRNGDHLADARMQLRDRTESLFHDPVYAAIGHGCAQVGNDGKVVNDIAHGRSLDQEYAGHATGIQVRLDGRLSLE